MKRKRTILALIAVPLALASALAACGGSDGPSGADEAASTVKIAGFLFKPEKLSVTPGTTVTWKNSDDIEHTVTSGTPEAPSGVFDSGDKTKDQTFSHTFSDPGAFTYFCNNHKSMRGEVSVT